MTHSKEIDCFVGQVLGGYQVDNWGNCKWTRPGDDKTFFFMPSQSWDDAITAACKSRLWKAWRIERTENDRYRFSALILEDNAWSSSLEYDDLPKAICEMFYNCRGRKMPEYKSV